jgi:hypothetical protein
MAGCHWTFHSDNGGYWTVVEDCPPGRECVDNLKPVVPAGSFAVTMTAAGKKMYTVARATFATAVKGYRSIHGPALTTAQKATLDSPSAGNTFDTECVTSAPTPTTGGGTT